MTAYLPNTWRQQVASRAIIYADHLTNRRAYSLSASDFGAGLHTLDGTGPRFLVGLVEDLPEQHPLRDISADDLLATVRGPGLIVGIEVGEETKWFDMNEALHHTLENRRWQRSQDSEQAGPRTPSTWRLRKTLAQLDKALQELTEGRG